MPTVTHGTRTAFGSNSNLNSLGNGAAKPLGAVDNSAGALGVEIDYSITLPGSSVSSSGYITLYLMLSLDNTLWTDNISPSTSSDIASSIKNARPIRTLIANANSQVVSGVFVPDTLWLPPYFSIITLNNCGTALPSSGNALYYRLLT